MVKISKTENIKRQPSLTRIIFVTSLGLISICIPFVFVFFNPILKFAIHQLRLANGTIINDLLLQEIESAKLYFYLFNVTNAERFMSGEDAALKLDEVGPFVYQEYRTNDDLELNVQPGVMRYTPNHRTELLLEESIGRPEDFYLMLPNIALLSAVHLLSKYPYFLNQIFKVLISGMNLKSLSRISAERYFWGNTDTLIQTVNTVVPGLVYFNSTGLNTRLYDPDAKYRLTLGTTDLDKFQIKSLKRSRINSRNHSELVFEKTIFYNDTYEGVAFPPQMTPEMPIYLYRHGICRNFRMRYIGTRAMDYGADAFLYSFHNSTFGDRTVCNSKGWCPNGVLDLSPCFYGFPFAITKGHFLDADPKMLNKIEGLKPDRKVHDTTFTVDPNLGVALEASMSVQLNLALGDMSLLRETSPFSDIFVPVTRAVIRHPKMRKETRNSLRLMYTYGPLIIMSAQAAFAVLGISLLAYSAKMMNGYRAARNKTVLTIKHSILSQAPLLNKK